MKTNAQNTKSDNQEKRAESYSVGKLIYDPKVYDGLNRHTEDISFYRTWIKDQHICKVLEVCCGTGRIAIPLAQSGVEMTGLDLNESMLSEARSKAEKANVPIDFHQGDMRRFSLGKQYQLVFIPFNSIHCLYTHEDITNTFASIRAHVADGGYFIIDYFNPDISYIVENQGSSMEIANFVTDDGRDICIKQSMHYERDSQINRIKWEHIVNGRSHSVESLDMRMFYPQELDYYIKSCGFTIAAKYGDYQMNPFISGSPTQLIVCRKIHKD